MKTDYSNKGLVRQCQKGNRKAMKQLYESHSTYLFGVCRRYMKDRMLAEEMLSDAFLKIFDKLAQLDDASKLRPWMKTLTIRTCLDELKKQRLQYVDLDEHRISEMIEVQAEEVEDCSAQEIKKHLEQLPEGYRTVFNLSIIEGFTHKEIAEMLSITEGTSKSQLSKSKRQIKSSIEDSRRTQPVF